MVASLSNPNILGNMKHATNVGLLLLDLGCMGSESPSVDNLVLPESYHCSLNIVGTKQIVDV